MNCDYNEEPKHNVINDRQGPRVCMSFFFISYGLEKCGCVVEEEYVFDIVYYISFFFSFFQNFNYLAVLH